MNLISAHTPSLWLWSFWLIAAPVAGVLIRRTAWPMLLEKDNLNIFMGACVAVLGLWMIKTGIKPGLNFHLLGATALTLMFRPLFAMLAMALVTLAITAWQGDMAAFAENWLIMGVIPIALSWAIFKTVEKRLPNHLFIYIFFNAFFGAAAVLFFVGLSSTAVLTLTGAYPLAYLLEEYLPYFLLVAWGEAFTTGMLITVLVIWRPQWVATFSDQRYLNR